MFEQSMILFLIGHIVGDFYVQIEKVIEGKQKQIRWVLIHAINYILAFLMISVPFMSLEILAMIGALSISHFLINIGEFFLNKRMGKKHKLTQRIERTLYLGNQILQILSIVCASFFMVTKNMRLKECSLFLHFFSVVGASETVVGSWILVLLIIHKPANTLIQKFVGTYKPANQNYDFKRDNNAGRVIGTVDRIIMVILISIGQYSAIGLVLTAKSIARYDRISKDETFAEYYLLGTLISAAIVIASATILL